MSACTKRSWKVGLTCFSSSCMITFSPDKLLMTNLGYCAQLWWKWEDADNTPRRIRTRDPQRLTPNVLLLALSALPAIDLTSASMTGPQSPWRRWTSSMMRSLTSWARETSPGFRVTTSHFSGVVTSIWTRQEPELDYCWSWSGYVLLAPRLKRTRESKSPFPVSLSHLLSLCLHYLGF